MQGFIWVNWRKSDERNETGTFPGEAENGKPVRSLSRFLTLSFSFFCVPLPPACGGIEGGAFPPPACGGTKGGVPAFYQKPVTTYSHKKYCVTSNASEDRYYYLRITDYASTTTASGGRKCFQNRFHRRLPWKTE